MSKENRDDDRGHTKSIFSQIQRKSLDKELLGYPDNEWQCRLKTCNTCCGIVMIFLLFPLICPYRKM